jgi:PIN domain nuclease of toxin-antitoxin system
VAELLPGSVISALNYSEVVQKLTQLGSATAEDDTAALIALGTTVASFDTTESVNAARLWEVTRKAGLCPWPTGRAWPWLPTSRAGWR